MKRVLRFFCFRLKPRSNLKYYLPSCAGNRLYFSATTFMKTGIKRIVFWSWKIKCHTSVVQVARGFIIMYVCGGFFTHLNLIRDTYVKIIWICRVFIPLKHVKNGQWLLLYDDCSSTMSRLGVFKNTKWKSHN